MSFKNILPSVSAQEPDEELVDPQVTLKEKCGDSTHCAHLKEKLDACTDRVNSRTKTDETCVEELFDFIHCVDHCVSKSLFSLLK
ncbi:cytochrome b-c1 complex subunit 6, mitochondrial-like [Lycorma delicatula]|uniref:cytochrome b-c1 complex subunit 6, mitochondrial-like n=1 Tax=Lycorma delicatula TaxID=130591 RepID=UPI003F50E7FE